MSPFKGQKLQHDKKFKEEEKKPLNQVQRYINYVSPLSMWKHNKINRKPQKLGMKYSISQELLQNSFFCHKLNNQNSDCLVVRRLTKNGLPNQTKQKMKQTNQAANSKRRQSMTESQGQNVSQNRLSIPNQKDKEQSSHIEPSVSDFAEERKSSSYNRCQCCRNKIKDDYLKERRERRIARENRERKRTQPDVSSHCSHHSGYHSNREHASVNTVSSRDESSFDDSSADQNLTPRPRNRSNIQDFLIKASPVNDLKPSSRSPQHQTQTPSKPSVSPLRRSQSGKKQHQASLIANELFSIKEIEQSASFGERSSLLENKPLNFEEQVNQKGEVSKFETIENTGATLRIMMRYKGSLYERSWKNTAEYVRVLEKIREMFAAE